MTLAGTPRFGVPWTERIVGGRAAHWLPLSVVIVALLALGFLPALVAHRVRAIRQHVDTVLDPARRAVAHLEHTVLATVLPTEGRASTMPVADAQGIVADDLALLDSLMSFADPAPRAQFTRVRAAVVRWVGMPSPYACSPVVSGGMLVGLRCQSAAARLIRTTTDLGTLLDSQADAERRGGRALEQWDVVMPVLLVPLALLAVAMTRLPSRNDGSRDSTCGAYGM